MWRNMRRLQLHMTFQVAYVLALACLTAGCDRGESRPTTPEKSTAPTAVKPADPQQKALAAKDALMRRLSAELLGAMSRGGPAAAIEVCSERAPRLAAEVSESEGVNIGRTSFKLRNPSNTPPDWAAKLIEQRVAEAQFLELPGGVTGALLPILLQPLCVSCHGTENQLAEGVKEKLQERYPVDQATGFKEGDLRGWFWVEVPASPPMTQ